MNSRKNDPDKAAHDNGDEGVLEKIAKTIAPPSREVSDAELIDPGANSPAAKPKPPKKSSASRPRLSVKSSHDKQQR